MADLPAPTVADATRSVLLAIRLRAVAEPGAIRDTLASLTLAADGVETLLGRLDLAGLVEHRDGTNPGWRLTTDGRREGERLLAVELDGRGIRSGVTDAYERFVTLNGPLLRACTDWQLRDANPSAPVVNDHSDAAFDQDVIARLAAVHEAVLPVCAALAFHLGRFSNYAPRFTRAMDRIKAGDHAAVDQPLTDSYHSIWFELHDHLLATLGRDRSQEPLPAPAYIPPKP